MSKIFSFFSPTPKPPPPPPPPPAPEQTKAAAKAPTKKTTKRAQLIALKATGSGGLQDEANVGRRKILV